MFRYGINWISVPTWLYFSLIVIFGALLFISIFKIVKGFMKKYTKKYFLLWMVALLTSVAYFVAIWGAGVIVINSMLGGSGNEQNGTVMEEIRRAVAAKIETTDNGAVYVDSEIAVLKSFAGLQIHEAPMEPADSEEDWIYRITFNPSEKVAGSEEIVVSFHDTYVQINNEYYLPDEGVEYSSIMEWVQSKAVYIFD